MQENSNQDIRSINKDLRKTALYSLNIKVKFPFM